MLRQHKQGPLRKWTLLQTDLQVLLCLALGSSSHLRLPTSSSHAARDDRRPGCGVPRLGHCHVHAIDHIIDALALQGVGTCLPDIEPKCRNSLA